MAKTINRMLQNKAAFKINGSLWIECDNTRFFGPGPVELLERIRDTGSINQAAKQMKMSYKKAWQIIHIMNEQVVHPVVIMKSGGEKGGGSIVTDEAIELIKLYTGLRKRFKMFLEKETKRLNNTNRDKK